MVVWFAPLVHPPGRSVGELQRMVESSGALQGEAGKGCFVEKKGCEGDVKLTMQVFLFWIVFGIVLVFWNWFGIGLSWIFFLKGLGGEWEVLALDPEA